MQNIDIAALVIVVLTLVIVALLLVNYVQGKPGAMTSEAKQVIGATAALAVFFALKSENKLDDFGVNNILLPVLKLLDIDVPAVDVEST